MKTVLFFLFFVAIYWPLQFAPIASAISYYDSVIGDNPIAYWRFEEQSGSSSAKDWSGNGRDGTYQGGVLLEQAGAFSNSNAAYFDGTNDYITLPGTWGGTSEVSIEAWFNIENTSDDFQAIVSSTELNFIHLQTRYTQTNPGNIAIYTNNGYQGLKPLEENTGWHHVVLSVSSGDINLYLDGQVIDNSSFTFTQITSTSYLRIGSGYRSGRFFNGLIDEVAIYDYALSPDQIQEHYQAATSPVPIPSSLALFVCGMLGTIVASFKKK